MTRVATDFTQLLAFEQGEHHEPPSLEITEAMIDQLASRVTQRLSGSVFANQLRDAILAAMRDSVSRAVAEASERLVRAAVPAVVSETSERLIRDTVPRVVAETSERFVRDAVKGVVAETSERFVRDAVPGVVAETSERLVRDTVLRSRGGNLPSVSFAMP